MKTPTKQGWLYFIRSHLILCPKSPIARWWDCPVSNWEVMGLIPAMRRGRGWITCVYFEYFFMKYICTCIQFFFKKKCFLINIPWVKASCIHAEPTFGAPSLSTQSAFQVWSSLFISWKWKKTELISKYVSK